MQEHPHVTAALHFHYRGMFAPLPPGIQPAGRLRDRIRETPQGRVGRCQIPHHVPQVFSEIDDALAAAWDFTRKVIEEENSLLGEEGVNSGMRHLSEAMCCCFDWERLVYDKPTPDDIRAFGVVAELLLPYLKVTDWPNLDEFPHVLRRWPDTANLQFQYVGLTRLVRLAASRCRRGAIAAGWFAIKEYVVEPVCVFVSVSWFVHAWADKHEALGHWIGQLDQPHQRAFLKQIASSVSSCLFKGFFPMEQNPLPQGAPPRQQSRRPFRVSTTKVARLGIPWQQSQSYRPHKTTREKWKYSHTPGGLGVLLLPGQVGKLVHIVRVVEEVNASAVSASLDGDPWFSHDAEPDFPKWHAVRIHSRCRPMGAAEACCERVGSLMKQCYNEVAGMSKNELMDHVLLTEARVSCIGSDRDETLCRHVVEVFQQKGYHVKNQCRMARKRHREEGLDSSRCLKRLRAEAEECLLSSGRATLGRPEGPLVLGKESDITPSSTVPAPLPKAFTNSLHVAAISEWPQVKTLRRRYRGKSAPPMIVSHSALQALEHNILHGRVVALPKFKIDRRTQERHLADSSVKDRYQAWLKSPAGTAWLQDRAELKVASSHG